MPLKLSYVLALLFVSRACCLLKICAVVFVRHVAESFSRAIKLSSKKSVHDLRDLP